MPVDTDPSPSEPTDLPAGWPRHWTIVGVGGVGGLYGGRLAASGADVRFLARSDVDHLRRHGLELRSPWGDAHVRDLAVAGAAAELGPSDVIVLATKTTDNARVVAQLGPLVGPSTAVLALQNGLGIEAPIAEALGVPVLGGLCFVCSAKEAPGVIVHQDYGLVTVGEHAAGGVAAGATARVAAIVAAFEAAGIPVRPAPSLAVARWKKLVWNVPYNGLSVVLDAGTDELQADPATRALVEALMREVHDAAAACGHGFDATFVDQMLADTDAMTPYAPSMQLDYRAGRALELDAIYRAPVEAAAAAGRPMVRTEALWRQLAFLDRRARGARGTR